MNFEKIKTIPDPHYVEQTKETNWNKNKIVKKEKENIYEYNCKSGIKREEKTINKQKQEEKKMNKQREKKNYTKSLNCETFISENLNHRVSKNV